MCWLQNPSKRSRSRKAKRNGYLSLIHCTGGVCLTHVYTHTYTHAHTHTLSLHRWCVFDTCIHTYIHTFSYTHPLIAQVVCRILHTSEFCRETLEALGGAIAKDVKPVCSDKVCAPAIVYNHVFIFTRLRCSLYALLQLFGGNFVHILSCTSRVLLAMQQYVNSPTFILLCLRMG